MKSIFKKCLAMVISVSSILTMGVTSFADDATKVDSTQNQDGTVFRVDIPDKNGNYITLQGAAAQEWYNDAIEETKQNLIEDEKIAKSNDNNKSVSNSGTREMAKSRFNYCYRYVELKHTNDVKRYDLKRNVTNKIVNNTSSEQSYDLNLNVSQAWTINPEVTGKYKKAVTETLGDSWGKSYNKSETLNVKVAPGKSVQVEFIPIMDKSVGESQEYIVLRRRKRFVTNNVAVTTYNPKYTNCNVGPYNFETVAGAYIWINK